MRRAFATARRALWPTFVCAFSSVVLYGLLRVLLFTCGDRLWSMRF